MYLFRNDSLPLLNDYELIVCIHLNSEKAQNFKYLGLTKYAKQFEIWFLRCSEFNQFINLFSKLK